MKVYFMSLPRCDSVDDLSDEQYVSPFQIDQQITSIDASWKMYINYVISTMSTIVKSDGERKWKRAGAEREWIKCDKIHHKIWIHCPYSTIYWVYGEFYPDPTHFVCLYFSYYFSLSLHIHSYAQKLCCCRAMI